MQEHPQVLCAACLTGCRQDFGGEGIALVGPWSCGIAGGLLEGTCGRVAVNILGRPTGVLGGEGSRGQGGRGVGACV